jgi:hypothetical protein
VSAAGAPIMLPVIPQRALATALVLVMMFGLLPILSALIALNMAPLIGCRIDAAASVPCPLGPVDLGGVLHGMAVIGWFGFTTAPPAMLLMTVWLAAALAFVARGALARKGYVRV